MGYFETFIKINPVIFFFFKKSSENILDFYFGE